MTAYRVEIWCDGCGVKYAVGMRFEQIDEGPKRAAAINECAQSEGWVRDGAANFCTSCQCKRSEGPIIDCLAMSVEPAEAR
jgi:hypothetical protein